VHATLKKIQTSSAEPMPRMRSSVRNASANAIATKTAGQQHSRAEQEQADRTARLTGLPSVEEEGDSHAEGEGDATERGMASPA
jgi:hypothetical protein